MVRGLGPREDPTGMEVVLKVTLLLLSDRDMKDAGLDRPETGREGIWGSADLERGWGAGL